MSCLSFYCITIFFLRFFISDFITVYQNMWDSWKKCLVIALTFQVARCLLFVWLSHRNVGKHKCIKIFMIVHEKQTANLAARSMIASDKTDNCSRTCSVYYTFWWLSMHCADNSWLLTVAQVDWRPIGRHQTVSVQSPLWSSVTFLRPQVMRPTSMKRKNSKWIQVRVLYGNIDMIDLCNNMPAY